MTAPQLDLTAHVVTLAGETDFAGWRDAARHLALKGVLPQDVSWEVGPLQDGPERPLIPLPEPSPRNDGEKEAVRHADALLSPPLRGEGKGEGRRDVADLHHEIDKSSGSGDSCPQPSATLSVTRDFVERAQTVICHSDPARFALLYRLLWRLRVEPDFLKIASEPDVRRFETLEKSVRRDIHKMRAFVRFRKIGDGCDERFVAWFEPDHFIVERNAPFFVRRFTGMRWTILTPHASASWDGDNLAIGPGADRRDAPSVDATEELWRTYFQNIFNPARLKVKAMQSEMPKKYWRNLPEASLIPGMIEGAGQAASDMVARMATTPAPHHERLQARHWSQGDAEPADGSDAHTIDALRQAATGCRRCPLWREATQTVFGDGPDDARIVFVGEQPGDHEDLAGLPFVGPAGKVFDSILADAGIDRGTVYVTNAVKHFKFEPRGKRRIHQRPNAGEVQACRWWVDKELSILRPDLVVALGATAALSLLGKAIPVTKMRGEIFTRGDGLRVFITIHPSFILRIPDPANAAAERLRFLKDMQAVKGLMAV